jgi:uncharacterized protein
MVSVTRQKCRDFVAKYCAGYDASHDISHIDRVVTNAIRILNLSDADTKERIKEDVIIAIASLHDSFDHKYLTSTEQVEKAKTEVCTFLKTNLGFDDSTIDMMIVVIDNMGFTTEMKAGGNDSPLPQLTQEYMHIVQDADRLDAIGAIGVARCLAFTGAFGRPIMTESGEEEKKQREKYLEGTLVANGRKGPSAIAHFYDKLVFLKDMLKTPAGRKLGERRHKFILSFLDEFFDELSTA